MPGRVAGATLIASVIAAVFAALAPANHIAGHWDWGHNHVAYNVNSFVPSGWNYWYDIFVHKHSGDWIRYGWNGQTTGCVRYAYLGGAWQTGYWTAWEADCAGYNRGYVAWDSGHESYLYFDLYT